MAVTTTPYLEQSYTPTNPYPLPTDGFTSSTPVNPYPDVPVSDTPLAPYQPPTTTSDPVPTAPQDTGPSPEELERQRLEDEIRSGISSGYDNYFAELDAMMNTGLTGQQTAQEGIIGNQFAQGTADVELAGQQGQSDLALEGTKATQNQDKNMKDIAENLRNMFQAGNVFLGARGAGDSSAANQYSYALQKQGNKSRGDVMSQTSNIMAEINSRTTKLKDTVSNELQRLSRDRDNKLNELTTWFNEAQNQIRQAKASGQLSKSQDLAALSRDLLNNAMSRLDQVETDARNRRSALDEWAMSNASTINQLKTNMQSVAGFQANMPTAQPLAGINQTTGSQVPNYTGLFNPTTEEEPNIFS